MRTPPRGVDPDDVLRTVRTHWLPDADRLTHLPVGFGAHHWRADGPSASVFVTLDSLGDRHDLASLTAAYDGARALAGAGLDFVHAGQPPVAVPFGGGALSATPWLAGTSPERIDVAATDAMLARLHTATPPPALPRWSPLVAPTLAADLAARTADPWTLGPYGEQARTALTHHLDDVAGWTRDLRTLDPTLGDLRMQELFDLEWRLDEIRQYADWFAAPHTGTADDDIALGGLLEELTR